MSRSTIRLAAAGGAVAITMLTGGTAFAASYSVGVASGGNVNGGGTGANGSGTGNTTNFSSNGGTVTGGGGASTSGTGTSSSNLPFTGFELATVLTLGAGAIAAGSTVVVVSRRRRDTSALA